jgi:chemotaxis protein CheZ
MGIDIPADLSRRLEDLRSQSGETVSTTEITEVVQNMLATLEGDLTGNSLRLYNELEKLYRVIEAAKSELSQIKPEEIREEHLPAAADELDAIVAATEGATNTIMESAEAVQNVADEIGGKQAEVLVDAVTNIFEACSFQDITGQRITKVVKTLKVIETKIEDMLAAFGDEMAKARKEQRKAEAEAEAQPDSTSADADLLHGPQKEGDGISQDDIDALLASFD